VEIRRVVNLGDFNSLAYTFGLEESVPEGKKKSEHLKDVTNHLEALMTKKLLENSVIESGD
jgi:hypothetical protein